MIKEPSIRHSYPWPNVEENAWATQLADHYVSHLHSVFLVVKEKNPPRKGIER